MTKLADPDAFFGIIKTQSISIILGFALMFFILKYKKINYLFIRKSIFLFFVIALILQILVLVPGIGVNINGAFRWINLGIIIQPSEIFRVVSIIYIAHLLFNFQNEIKKDFWFFAKFFLLPFFFIIVPFYVVIKDLGSLMIFSVSILGMFLLSSQRKKVFLIFFILFVFASLSGYFFIPHMKKRIDTWYNSIFATEKLDYTSDYYQNYNMIKAVGSGMMTGVGYGGSIQKFNKNISEITSDSIFSVFAEEWGFIFSTILVLIYLFLSVNIFLAATKIKNYFERLVVVGLGINLVFPAYYNIGAALGIAPLSGIPLTFISKGGTAILMSLISVSLILLFVRKR